MEAAASNWPLPLVLSTTKLFLSSLPVSWTMLLPVLLLPLLLRFHSAPEFGAYGAKEEEKSSLGVYSLSVISLLYPLWTQKSQVLFALANLPLASVKGIWYTDFISGFILLFLLLFLLLFSFYSNFLT